MPLYHFDVADRFPPIAAEGVLLGSLGQARQHALEFAGRTLADQTPGFWVASDWVLTVSDEQHLTLFTLSIFANDAPTIHAPN